MGKRHYFPTVQASWGKYKPITLLSIIGKLFGLVIEKRITDWSEAVGAISDEQGGFRRARGTPDQIFHHREQKGEELANASDLH